MKRLVVPVLALGVLIALIGSLAKTLALDRRDYRLVLVETEGTVTVEDADRAVRPAKVGESLAPQDRVATQAASRAVLALGRETRIRLGEGSTVRVTSVDGDGNVALELEDGALHATVRPDSGSLRVTSGTREALVTDADLAFGVGPDRTLQIEVSRGEVLVGGIPGASELFADQRLVAPEVGHPEIGDIRDDLLLAVEWPERRTRQEKVRVEGHTAAEARVRVIVGGVAVEVRADRDGRFAAVVPLVEGDNEVRLEATDLLGNVAAVHSVVQRDISGPSFRGGVEYGD